MLGIVAAIIAGIKKRTWFAVFSGMYAILILCALAFTSTGGEEISGWTVGWLPFIISLFLKQNVPQRQVVVVREDTNCREPQTFCRKCGNPIDSEANFCKNCGAKIE